MALLSAAVLAEQVILCLFFYGVNGVFGFRMLSLCLFNCLTGCEKRSVLSVFCLFPFLVVVSIMTLFPLAVEEKKN